MSYYVYLLASRRNGTLYVGMTNDLVKRIWQHKTGAADGFTKRYRIHQLVWFEQADDPIAAIAREKQIKRWNREWKLKLIEDSNPVWNDLYDEICR